MSTEADTQVWGRLNPEYKIQIEKYMVHIKGLNGKNIKYDQRHGIPMPEEAELSPFVHWEYRSEVFVPSEKHFIEYLRKLGYRRLA